jgi:hypothetical protein
MEASLKLLPISPQGFARLGMTAMAYIKPISQQDRVVYAVHAADGRYLWRFDDPETARAALRQHEIEPVSVH